MAISLTIYMFCLILFYSGVSRFIDRKESRFRVEHLQISRGWLTKGKKYQQFRFGILTAMLAVALFLGENELATAGLMIYFLMEPSDRIFGFTTPYGLIRRRLIYIKERKKERELYEGISFLKNMIVIPDNCRVSADAVIESLFEYSDLLRPVYSKMLNYLRMNRKEEALRFFALESGAGLGRDFGRLLLDFDQVPPDKLLETLISYQKTLKEMNLTNLKKKDEMISDLVYLPVVLNVVLIFINFIYIAYFLDQKEMLQMFLM